MDEEPGRKKWELSAAMQRLGPMRTVRVEFHSGKTVQRGVPRLCERDLTRRETTGGGLVCAVRGLGAIDGSLWPCAGLRGLFLLLVRCLTPVLVPSVMVLWDLWQACLRAFLDPNCHPVPRRLFCTWQLRLSPQSSGDLVFFGRGLTESWTSDPAAGRCEVVLSEMLFCDVELCLLACEHCPRGPKACAVEIDYHHHRVPDAQCLVYTSDGPGTLYGVAYGQVGKLSP